MLSSCPRGSPPDGLSPNHTVLGVSPINYGTHIHSYYITYYYYLLNVKPLYRINYTEFMYYKNSTCCVLTRKRRMKLFVWVYMCAFFFLPGHKAEKGPILEKQISLILLHPTPLPPTFPPRLMKRTKGTHLWVRSGAATEPWTDPALRWEASGLDWMPGRAGGLILDGAWREAQLKIDPHRPRGGHREVMPSERCCKDYAWLEGLQLVGRITTGCSDPAAAAASGGSNNR